MPALRHFGCSGYLKMKKHLFSLLLVLALALPAFITLVRPGLFPMQDDMQVFRLQQMGKCFLDGQIPCRWVPDAGYQYGYPLFNYYSPLVYYLGQLIHTVGFQYVDSLKTLFILGFILAAVSMYFLANEFFGKWPAVIAATLYTLAPYKAQEVYVRGALSEFWASVFFPLILWAIYKLITKRRRKYFFWTAISIGGIFLTHNLLSFLFIPIILFWSGYWLLMERKDIAWRQLVLAIILGVSLSGFFLIPMLFERSFVHIDTLIGGYFDYRQHFVTLKQLFLSNHWGYGSSTLGPNDDLSLSTGIVHWVLGLIALFLALFNFKKNKKLAELIFGFGVIELVVLFLTHEKSSFIWSIIIPLKWLQFPWRFLSLSVFILSFLSAAVFYYLPKLKIVLGVCAIITVMALQVNFFRPVSWLNVSDNQKLSGSLWEKELTSSIFDYLPIYAQLPPNSKALGLPEVLTGNAAFGNYFKGSDFQTGVLTASENSLIRLPFFDFPGMTVYLNNYQVAHIHDICAGEPYCFGLISFTVPAGKYNFKVELENTPIRTMGNILSVLSLIILSFLVVNKNEKLFQK